MKLVSVIVVAYKSADTIVQTLDSIKDQTYKNIQLIVTDDCSPDDTVAVASAWMEKNEGALTEMRLVTAEKNTGIPGNINRALKVASGDYMKLMAADDYFTRDAISEYVKFCEKNPNVLPVSRVRLFASEGEESDFAPIDKYCERCYDFAQMTDYKQQLHAILKQNCIVAPAGSFYPMELVRKLGGYDESYRMFEDYPMHIKAMREGYRYGFINRELVCYRISGGSITAAQQQQLKKTQMQFFFRERMYYMMQGGMAWEAVKQVRYWAKVALEASKEV